MNERILKYFDGQLTESEMENFEDELRSSPELKKEYDEFLSVQSKLNDLKNVEIDKTFFNGIVPEFRKRLEIKKKSRKIFSFSFANSLVAVVLLYLVLSPSTDNLNLYEAVKNWTENDYNYAVEYVEQHYNGFDITDEYNIAGMDSVISDMLANELNLSGNFSSYQLMDNSIDFNTVGSQINNTEANKFYKEILNKKYF